MRQRKSGAGFWFGLMLGVAIGVALAIMFMPRPGGNAAGDQSDTDGFDLRQRAQERFGPLIERLRERYSEAFALGQDFYERAKEDVMTQYNSAKSGEFSNKS
jgi:gas vesicle protein